MVKNPARDARRKHQFTSTPVVQTGFLSNRTRPAPAAFETIATDGRVDR